MIVCCQTLRTGDKSWSANSGWYCANLPATAIRRRGGRQRRFFDYEIVAVYLWAVLHDRPTCWACDPANWPNDLWRKRLPSQSTMSRRLQTIEVQRLLHAIERRMAAAEDHHEWVLRVDGKPLLAGAHSKDPDARWGRVRRGWAKGYKFHAIYGRSCMPLSWEVTPLNVAESEVAAPMIPSLKPGGGYLLGDCAFDSNPLHHAARAQGYVLVAPRKRPQAGLGHRCHDPGRLRCIDLLQGKFGQALFRLRKDIERQFGWLTNHAGGLAPLPNWVRRSHRVRLWVQAKLLVHGTYVYLNSRPPPLACA
jgi:hypothetical protein